MDLNNHRFEEAVWCQIKCEGKPIIVGTVYRTPKSCKENNDLLLDILTLTLMLVVHKYWSVVILIMVLLIGNVIL